MQLKLKKNSKQTHERHLATSMGKIGKDLNVETWNVAALLFQVYVSLSNSLVLSSLFEYKTPLSQFKVRDFTFDKDK